MTPLVAEYNLPGDWVRLGPDDSGLEEVRAAALPSTPAERVQTTLDLLRSLTDASAGTSAVYVCIDAERPELGTVLRSTRASVEPRPLGQPLDVALALAAIGEERAHPDWDVTSGIVRGNGILRWVSLGRGDLGTVIRYAYAIVHPLEDEMLVLDFAHDDSVDLIDQFDHVASTVRWTRTGGTADGIGDPES